MRWSLLPLSLLIAGCAMDRVRSREKRAYSLLDQGKLEQCHNEFSGAYIDLNKWSPEPEPHALHVLDRARLLYGRAVCAKGLGMHAKAIADMELSLQYSGKRCSVDLDTVMRSMLDADKACQLRSDQMELLARWKKELAATGSQEKR